MSRRANPRRLALTLGWQVASLTLTVVALAVGARTPAAVGLAGVAAALALPGPVTAVPVAVWVLDSAWRAGRVGFRVRTPRRG